MMISNPVRVSEVKAYCGLTPADTADDAWLAACTDAVMAFISTARPDLRALDAGHRLGLLLLAMRWYDQRGRVTDSGMDEGFGGTLGPIPTITHDIERLLRTGRYAKSVVA